MYTQGFWSQPTEAAGAHEIREAAAIRTGLSRHAWSTSGVVGDIDWEFDAATETVETPWGYEDPKTIGQSIATLDTLISNVIVAQTVIGGGGGLAPLRRQYEEARDILDQVQAGGTMRSPYYADLPHWVDKPGAMPPAFDPNVPTYQLRLDPQPRWLTAQVGHFFVSPAWNPTLTPGLEILKCEGRSATEIRSSPTTFDNNGISCPSPSGWTYTGRSLTAGTCSYTRRVPGCWVYVSPPDHRAPRYWVDGRDRSTTRNWSCDPLNKTIEIGSDTVSRTLPGVKVLGSGCRYTFPRSRLNNYSLLMDEIDVDPSLSSSTVGHDITDNTFSRSTTPTGWGVRWVEHTPPQWTPGPCGNKPCWPTFVPDVRMSPRLDQLLVGTPVWVWMNNVSRSCLPAASPSPPGSDCDLSQPSLWQAWPALEADPNRWRHERLRTQAGNIWRAAFPQKVSIELTPTGGGATSTYECWTDGALHSAAVGEWAPGQRPTLDAGSMPLATPTGPLNPGVGDCVFVHTSAGPPTATVRIHWIGKVGNSSPRGNLVWQDPDPLLGDVPPAPTSQTMPVVFYELHTIPGP